MIRYASVLPLGTMGYRAPEVRITYLMYCNLVYSISTGINALSIIRSLNTLYYTDVDIWSFGCLQFSSTSLDLQTTRSMLLFSCHIVGGT